VDLSLSSSSSTKSRRCSVLCRRSHHPPLYDLVTSLVSSRLLHLLQSSHLTSHHLNIGQESQAWISRYILHFEIEPPQRLLVTICGALALPDSVPGRGRRRSERRGCVPAAAPLDSRARSSSSADDGRTDGLGDEQRMQGGAAAAAAAASNTTTLRLYGEHHITSTQNIFCGVQRCPFLRKQ
jgi:hypothetical protein